MTRTRWSILFAISLCVLGLTACDDGGGETPPLDVDMTQGEVDAADTSPGEVTEDVLEDQVPNDTVLPDTRADVGVELQPDVCDGEVRCGDSGNVETCRQGTWVITDFCSDGCEEGRCLYPSTPGACGNPHELTLGTPVNGNTSEGAPNNEWAAACTSAYGYSPAGPELVYTLELASPTTVLFTLTPVTATFFGLYVRGTCDPDDEYGAACDGTPSEVVGMQIELDLGAGTHFVFVDDFGSDGSGPGEFQLLAEGSSLSTCYSQMPTWLTLPSILEGNTADGDGETHWLEYHCPQDAFQTTGNEVMYAFTLHEAGPFHAQVTSLDPDDSQLGVYVRSDCEDRFTQVACGYSNGTGPAVINEELGAGTYFLFVDDFGAGLGDGPQTFLLELSQ